METTRLESLPPDPTRDPTRDQDPPSPADERQRIILGELNKRMGWLIRLRWWVPPAILAAVTAGGLIGITFPALPLLAIAAFILAYNIGLYALSRWRLGDSAILDTGVIHRFTHYQVILDYASMFLLIHFTGGAASPLIFFFIFHIIFASILLPARSAYGLAALVAGGMIAIAAAEYEGLWVHHPLIFRNTQINLAQQPFHVMIELAFFSASVFITAFTATAIMGMLRKRILALANLSDTMCDLNHKLNALYSLVQAVSSIRSLEQLLQVVATELCQVMGTQAISIKLISDDGKTLCYAAAHGLPAEFTAKREIDVDKSPMNRRIIEGEHFVTGEVSRREMFQFGEDLAALGLKSVLFAPLKVEDRVSGILGAYCNEANRFQKEEVDFFLLAAGLVAIALENARYYEAKEKMIRERAWFMMRVAHNLRAPLGAALSILEVVQGEYLGDLNQRQASYLKRIEYPIRNMLSTINELMVLYAQRSEQKKVRCQPLQLDPIVQRVTQAFHEEAAKKNIRFSLTLPEALPQVNGNGEMLEQMLENLVSNAIKYTRAGGEVKLCCAADQGESLRIEVTDNGIGIPRGDLPRLFTEFFRAENAKEVERVGTGLGLAIVKEIVDQHQGRIRVVSEEGMGTIFLVNLPLAQANL